MYNTKGLKRFEKSKLKNKDEIDLHKMSVRKATDKMTSLRNKSSYVDTFGKDAEADHASSILHFKRLDEVPCSKILDRVAFAYFEKWLRTARDTYYKDLLMTILKAIHVYTEGKVPSKSLHKHAFSWVNKDEVQKPPRIDKLRIRKFNFPGEEERLTKFPQLRNVNVDTKLDPELQKFDKIRKETRILSRTIKNRTIIKNPFNHLEDVKDVPVDLNLSK